MRIGPDREPETRKWIEQINVGAETVLWDIGANVGSFSIFAAKRGISVVAVEPMPQNLHLLTENIALNGVMDNCLVLPIPLSRSTRPNTMWLTSGEFGSANHQFGLPTRDGEPILPTLGFRATGTTVDDAVAKLGLPAPTHLKIDVDGIDDEIIYGSEQSLANITGICCEVKFHRDRVSRLVEFLKSHNLRLIELGKRNAIFSR
jgi:FkbM family methyltransferase